MRVVAGLSLRNLKPHVWNLQSPFFLPSLKAVMVSYADFQRMPYLLKSAMNQGIHACLNIPNDIKVYLDNGAFSFLRNSRQVDSKAYEQFVQAARPDWYPIPFDAIPSPAMSPEAQHDCFQATMRCNLEFQHDGYVPVVHISRFLSEYVEILSAHPKLSNRPRLALGGIVPNLLRAPKALPLDEILASVRLVRKRFAEKELHIFGVGGTATLHIAALLGVDSVDSSGWRNRAARGIVQIPGSGDRVIADLGKWRGRNLSQEERQALELCECPACKHDGSNGLQRSGLIGFCHRATHNLWVLLEEKKWLEKHIADGTYNLNYESRLNNTTYLPFIKKLIGTCPTQPAQ